MLLAYIDESYSREEYWFGAVLVAGDRDAALQRAVIGIAPRYAKEGVSADAEIHGYPLWNGSEEWEPLEPRLREDVMRRALREIGRAGATVIFVGLDRTTDTSLNHLNTARAAAVDRVLDCLENHCVDVGERCLLLFDEETSTSEELFARVHRHHREILESGADPRIIERPVSVPSHDTPGVQIADVAVYLRGRVARGLEMDSRAQASRDRLMKLITPYVGCEILP